MKLINVLIQQDVISNSKLTGHSTQKMVSVKLVIADIGWKIAAETMLTGDLTEEVWQYTQEDRQPFATDLKTRRSKQ